MATTLREGARAGELREPAGPQSQALKERLTAAEVGGTYWRSTFGRPSGIPVLDAQEGIYATDVDGNQYIDTYGAFAASCLGYTPSELIEPVQAAQRQLMHLSDMPNPPRVELAEELLSIAPGELKNGRVQFELGGGPAVDLGLKLALTSAAPRREIISFYGGYHGRTIGAGSLTASAYSRQGLPGMNVNITRIPYPYEYRDIFERPSGDVGRFCARYLEKLFESAEYGLYDPRTDECLVAALIVEPMQTHSGGILAPPEFYPMLREICTRYGIVFIDDEIAVGVGRTGRWFACELWDVEPDIIVTSKALSGGIWPISAIIARREVADAWADKPDKHMGTWHGDPVGCTAGTTVIRELKRRDMLTHVSEVGTYLHERLLELKERHPVVGDVSGVGLVYGIEFVRDPQTKEPADCETDAVVVEALRRGMLICQASYYGNRITLMPPYIVEREDIDTIVDILEQSIGAVFGR